MLSTELSFENEYGVALVSRIDKIIGLFLQKSPIKETICCKRDLNFIDSTNRSQPIVTL